MLLAIIQKRPLKFIGSRVLLYDQARNRKDRHKLIDHKMIKIIKLRLRSWP